MQLQKTSYYKISVIIILKILLSLNIYAQGQNVTINELVASNATGLEDEDGDNPDWIEIYNPNDYPVNIGGYGMSDEPWFPYKWEFPDVIIPPNGFLIVFASGKDRNTPGQELHTNFKINKTEEYLVFINDNGYVIDEIIVRNLPTDISKGQYPDASGEWYYFQEPTPGQANTSQHYSEILSEPIFSHKSGYYENEFYLEIQELDTSVTVIYTIDGSEPCIDNLNGSTYSYKNLYPKNPGDAFGEKYIGSYSSHLYTTPIYISDISEQADSITQIGTAYFYPEDYIPTEPVKKAVTVRAKAYKDNAISSEIKSSTFFVGVNNETEMPVISLNTQENYLFDYYNGIYVPGEDFDNWRTLFPNLGVRGDRPANYRRRGVLVEHPANIEIFEPGNNFASHNQNVGIRIHGGFTRALPCKSFRIYFRNMYDDASLEYPIFNNDEYKSYKRLILRNSGNDWMNSMFRDALMQNTVKHLNIETQQYRPAILFLNGEYWGIHNIRERYDKHYLNRVFDVDDENIDYLYNHQLVKYGNTTHYYAIQNWMSENSVEDDYNYEYAKTQVDVINFADYQISNIYFCNLDWPRGNIDYWRLRTDEFDSISMYGHDGRWRWLLYDTDFGFGLHGPNYDHNTLLYASQWEGYTAANPLWSTFFLRHFLENERFRIHFVNRFADLLNTTFLPEFIIPIVDKFAEVIEPEMHDHINRWNSFRLTDTTEWKNNVEQIKYFVENRPDFQRKHILSRFDIDTVFNLELDVSSEEHGYVRVNTIEILESTRGIGAETYPWSGIYFADIPIQLEAIPYQGYRFVRWEGADIIQDALEENVFISEDISIKAVFEPEEDRLPIYYWHFNNLADAEFYEIEADYSFYEDKPKITYHGNDSSIMDRVSDGTLKNALEDTVAGYAVRLRNPSENQELMLKMSTKGFENIQFSYAYKRTSNGQEINAVYYSCDSTENWTRACNNIYVEEDYNVNIIDFNYNEAVNDNEDFKIKILFGGTNADNDEGNNRYDNVLLTGTPMPSTVMPPEVCCEIELITLIENSAAETINLDEIFNDPNGESLSFSYSVNYDFIAEVNQNDNLLSIKPNQRGESEVFITAHNSIHSVSTKIRVLVYPEAIALEYNPYTFDYWCPYSEFMEYPDNSLFLQSDMSDPSFNYSLEYAYYLSEDNFPGQESDVYLYPYNTNHDSRIKGLNEEGVYFYNTGTDRDLGGFLVALNTINTGEVYINWFNKTLERNQKQYAFRLQYRIGADGPFSPLTVNGEPLDFIASADFNYTSYENIQMPEHLIEQEYVQLLWQFFPVSGNEGERSKIRLDSIFISSQPIVRSPEDITEYNVEIYPNPAVNYININANTVFSAKLYNATGQKLKESLNTGINISDLPQGVYNLIVTCSINNHLIKRERIIKVY